MALILHIARAVDGGAMPGVLVSADTLASAADLIDYFKEHARAALGELRTPRSQLEDRVLKGLADRGPSTARTLHREVLHEAVKADRLKSTLERLLEDGRVTVSDAPTTVKGGRPTRVWAAIAEDDAPRGGKGKAISFRTQGVG
jgi:hypothetical protein